MTQLFVTFFKIGFSNPSHLPSELHLVTVSGQVNSWAWAIKPAVEDLNIFVHWEYFHVLLLLHRCVFISLALCLSGLLSHFSVISLCSVCLYHWAMLHRHTAVPPRGQNRQWQRWASGKWTKKMINFTGTDKKRLQAELTSGYYNLMEM